MTDYNKIKKLYEAGGSIPEISKSLSISKWKVKQILHKTNAKMRKYDRIDPKNSALIIKLYEDGNSVRKIVQLTGDSEHVIRKTLIENNIKFRKPIPLDENTEKQICEYYQKTKSLRKVKNKFYFDFKKTLKILNKYNIYHGKRKYELDESTFNEINSPEKAYLLGFIYADGNVSGNVLSIGQSNPDHKILYKFKKILKTNKPIYKNKKTRCHKEQPYELVITSKIIVRDLLKHGVMPDKSFKIKFPKYLNKSLIGHFIRGYFDGDGYFTIRKNRKASGTWAICSNKKFCEDIQKVLKNNKIVSRIYKNKRQKIYELRIDAFVEIVKLFYFLYTKSNKLCLSRKYNKFIKLFKQKKS